MKRWKIIPAWMRILQGYRPFLSVEVTQKCPLQCPGCYAKSEAHMNGKSLQRTEYQGDALVDRVLYLIRRYKPLHVSIVGGEPLVRQREMDALLRRLDSINMEVQVVTSAVRPIPASWAELSNLHLVVSIDGLPAEHDSRRAPASYERILNNVAGQKIIVHCVVLRSMLAMPNYLSEFAEFWSRRSETKKIWFSLYTPQKGEESQERLTARERALAIYSIARARRDFPIVYAPKVLLDGYRRPPSSPQECVFAQTTQCFASDLVTAITPCQLGGQPECGECGCVASAGLASIGRFKLAGLVKVGDIFRLSRRIGEIRNSRNRSKPLSGKTPLSWLQRDHLDWTEK